MKEYQTITTLSEYVKLVQDLGTSILYRGVSKSKYKLQPSLFRTNKSNFDSLEKNLMWVFKTNAKPFIEKLPSSEIEWLVIAQHHGLPTRLLDWSLSPLVACFFATRSQENEDGAIYINSKKSFMKEHKVNPKDLTEVKAFFPSHASTRVTAQSGMFTIHPSSDNELKNDNIIKYIIPKENKKEIFSTLVNFGIHDGTMFPGLDGLCEYIKHQTIG